MFDLQSITFVLLLIQALTLALPKDEARIVGGVQINITERPFQVKVHDSTCGGAIISKRHVLTAATCGTLNPSAVTVGTEHFDKFNDSDRITYKAESFKAHEKYDKRNQDFDIAIITLTEDIEFSDRVQPIQLAGPGYEVSNRTLLTVSGWGWDQPRFLDSLRKVVVPKVDDAACKVRYGTRVTENMMCAGAEKEKGPCTGDHGGPLVEETPSGNILVGLYIWASGCGRPKYPAVFTKVSALRKWIDDNSKL